MNGGDPLAALNPLRAPDAVSWWPLAPGWWILASLILIALCVIGWLLYRRYQRGAYRRSAIAGLTVAETKWARDGNDLHYLQQVNRILKIVAARSYGTDAVASLSGEPWLQFLRQRCAAANLPDTLASGPYRAALEDEQLTALSGAARHWVQHHEVPR